MVRIDKEYVFAGPDGTVSLLGLTALGRQEDWEEPKGRAPRTHGADPTFTDEPRADGSAAPPVPTCSGRQRLTVFVIACSRTVRFSRTCARFLWGIVVRYPGVPRN
jgi:hypothetical protein